MSVLLNTSIFDYLVADTDLFALVGNEIYPIRADNDTALPYIVYQRIDDIGVHHMRGASGYAVASYQFDVWGPHEPQATVNDIAEALRLALDGFQGLMGTLEVRSVLLEDQRDELADASDGSEQFKWRISFDFKFTYKRPTADLF